MAKKTILFWIVELLVLVQVCADMILLVGRFFSHDNTHLID